MGRDGGGPDRPDRWLVASWDNLLRAECDLGPRLDQTGTMGDRGSPIRERSQLLRLLTPDRLQDNRFPAPQSRLVYYPREYSTPPDRGDRLARESTRDRSPCQAAPRCTPRPRRPTTRDQILARTLRDPTRGEWDRGWGRVYRYQGPTTRSQFTRLPRPDQRRGSRIRGMVQVMDRTSGGDGTPRDQCALRR